MVFPIPRLVPTIEIDYSRVPANVKFEIDDAEASWTFRHKFDYIHIRYLAAAIVDWPKLMRQVYDATEPGGWAEFQDFDLRYYSEDGSLKEGHKVQQWITTLLKAAEDFGRDPSPGAKLEGYMRDAGFEDVHQEKYRMPIGPWPKDKHLVRSMRAHTLNFERPAKSGANTALENHRSLESGPARRWT